MQEESTLPYDPNDASSIEAYAKTLLGKTLRQTVGNSLLQKYRGKGKLGQLLESSFFQYAPNSIASSDFEKAGVELKTSPLLYTKNGFVSKERLTFNIINYLTDYKEDFYNSNFWKKNRQLLLMFYYSEKGKEDIDYEFKLIKLWQFPEEDLKIIKEDWEKIIDKIKEGKAHELSEGDTLYLGASTKGDNKHSLRPQPFSKEPAKQRAFSLKSKYINFILQKHFSKDTSLFEEYTPILSTQNIPEKTFEQIIKERFLPYLEKSFLEISMALDFPLSEAKSKLYLLSKAILGIRKKKIEEFEKADVEMKTIVLEANGTLKESMSFAQIQYKEILDEEWESSYWYGQLTKRYFFVVFQKEKTTIRLKKVLFWTMPIKDLELAKHFWEDTKSKIGNNNFSSLLRISQHPICHVRTKGINHLDVMKTAQNTLERKRSYWINASYIRTIVAEPILSLDFGNS